MIVRGEQGPYCGCCGDMMPEAVSLTTWANGATRCAKHHGRNCCAIEGCTRTRAAPLYTSGILQGEPWHDDAQVLCSVHWRKHVPPRSRARRAYHMFFRQAKQHGWGYKGRQRRSARLDWRFKRFWQALVRQARRSEALGHLDQAAIDAMFGWDQAEG